LYKEYALGGTDQCKFHELDSYVKHGLRQKYYLRYCDDFIILSSNASELSDLITPIRTFLEERLFLDLHPSKIILRPLHQGIDFLGYIQFFNYRLLRTRTKNRMLHKLKINDAKFLNHHIDASQMNQCLQSYLGILSHAHQYDLSQSLKNAYWVLPPATHQ
jgi:RNA-directed DNA polymerase